MKFTMKEMTMWKKILLGIGVLLAFAVIVIALALYFTGGITDVVRQQLDAIKAKDYAKAYSYTSKDFQKVTTLPEFEQFVDNYSALKDNKSLSVSSRERNESGAMIKGIIYSKDGATTPIEYHLVKEDNAWKILSITVNPAGPIVNETSTVSGPGDLSQVYDNQDSHYAIKYPANWEYDTSSRGTVIFSGKRGTASYFSTVNIQTVLAKKTGGDFSTVDQFVKDLKKQASGLSAKVNFIEEGPIEFTEADGKKAKGQFLIFTYNYKGMIFKQWQVVILRNDGQVFYAWAYTSPAEQYDRDVAVAKAMLNSWSIY